MKPSDSFSRLFCCVFSLCSFRFLYLPVVVFLTLCNSQRSLSQQPQPGLKDGEGYGRAKAEEESEKSRRGKAKRDEEISGIPALFVTPETGWGGGGAIVYLGPEFVERRDFGLVGFSYTERKQFQSIGFLEAYSYSEKWAWEVSYKLIDYPDYFFGVGRHVKFEDRELYTMISREVGAGIRWLPLPKLQLGIGVRQEDTSFRDHQDGGNLDKDLYEGSDGGLSRFTSLMVRYDTVDDIFSPRRGLWFRYDLRKDQPALGATRNSTKQTLNTSYFIPVHPQASLGTQFYMEHTAGEVPWYQMALLGGRSLLRGFYQGQYRDNVMVVTQTELRMDIVDRWGAVAFTGVGQIGETVQDLGSGKYLASSGGGLRYRLSDQQRINIRLDFGWTRDSDILPSTYLYILEAF
jgi:hypothetical protein